MLKVLAVFPKYTALRFSTKAAEKLIQHDNFNVESDINGMTVVSINQSVGGISKLAAVFPAGSRFETYENRGMNHFLRRCVGLSCNDRTPIGTTRNIQQMGANLRCFGTRETLAYVVDFSFDMIEPVGDLLSDIITRHEFYHWELRDYVKPLMLEDIEYLNRRDFDTWSSESLHKVAFGDSLGNSLYADQYCVGGWSLKTIEGFLDHSLIPHKSVLVGVNVNPDKLATLAEKFKMRPLKECVSVSKFRGGEIRRELPLDYGKMSLAWETPGFNSINCALASSVLAYSIDTDINNRIKWNHGALDLIKKVCTDSKVNEHSSANSFVVSYSDKGLLGFTVTGRPDVMHDAVNGVYAYFSDIGKKGVSQSDFDIAKRLLVNDILLKSGCGDGLLEHVISQSSSDNDILSVEELLGKVKSVTLDDVNKLAKHVLSNPKKAMVAIGDLSTTPFLGDLN